jgi:magnesium-transporting ATPase (P-type)
MSLFVSLQFVKAIQGGFMEQDPFMMYEGRPMKAMATDLNADLSQIEIIFSDKTGTLTNNEMHYRGAAVGINNMFHRTEENKNEIGQMLVDTVEQEMIGDRETYLYIMHFLLCMSLCHQAKPKKENGQVHSNNAENVIEYQAESPDEVALVTACLENDFVVKDCTDRYIDLRVFGQDHRFVIEALIEFTPERKKMSTVLRIPASFSAQFPWFLPEGTVISYTKVKKTIFNFC